MIARLKTREPKMVTDDGKLSAKELYAKHVRKLGEFLIKNADMFVENAEFDATLDFRVSVDYNGTHITLTKEFDIQYEANS